MSAEVVVVGVGAYVASASSDHQRFYERGDQVVVDDSVARRLVDDGVARYVGGGLEPEVETDDETELVFDPEGMKIADMLEFAEEAGLELPGNLDTSRRGPVIEAINSAIEAQEG